MNLDSLRNQWQRLSEPVIRRLQAEKLRHYLRTTVLPFSPYYRKMFEEQGLAPDTFRTLDDLQRIPFTTKLDLLPTAEQPQQFRDFILSPDEKVLTHRASTIARALLHGRDFVKQGFEAEFRPIFVTFTTGRSAEPTPFFFSQHDLDNLAIAGKRLTQICGGRAEYKMLNMFPFAPHLAFWLAHYAGTAGGILTLSSGGGKVMGTEGNLRQLRKLRPDVLIGMPTFIYHLLNQAAEQGVRCENLRRIVLGGEKVSQGVRQKLHDLAIELGAPDMGVVATYGFTEAKMAWPECPFPHNEPSPGS